MIQDTGPISQRLETQLATRLRWLIAIRLLVITSVLLPYILLQVVSLRSEAGPTVNFDFLYTLAGATYAASLLYIQLLKLLSSRIKLQALIQFWGDLLLITALVFYFGGVTSPFSILYLVVVIVASILVERRRALVVATSAWLLYAVTAVAIYFHWLTPPPTTPSDPISIWRLAYYLATHLFGFYAVALMTSRLAQSVTLAERALREQREDMAELQLAHRDVVQSIPSGLITADLGDQITSLNRAGEDILRRDETQLLGRPVYECGLFTEPQWRTVCREALEDPGRRREVEVVAGDQVLRIGFSISQLTAADGRPSGRIVIFQDLSEWHKLQEEVRIKDRMAAVGELASGIAHEIGNPLAAISGSVQMLSNSLDGRDAHQKLLAIIHKESQRLDRTIKGFLKFARPKDRSSVPLDISALLSEHVELLRNSPEVSDRHNLVLDLEPPAAVIMADPDQVSQIFWNLARNALRAMPDGGVLRIQGTLEGNLYRMQFIDNGRGMTEEERTNLFHPFRSHFDGGTGIGMAIVYQIVQEHGGRLRIASRPGEGSEITVELPAAAEAVEARAMEG